MLYGLREALRLIEEEGLPTRHARHRLHSAALMAGLGALGFAPFAQEGHRLPSLNAVTLPAGLDDAAVRTELLSGYGIEIGGGLGELKGKIWRIGLMGESAGRDHVLTLLGALEEIFIRGRRLGQAGAALESAIRIYSQTATDTPEPTLRKGKDRP
jgi:alanine-glyoxylate transaminase/serine-glyoxylate transaminase/serine-pyruvate transaminase